MKTGGSLSLNYNYTCMNITQSCLGKFKSEQSKKKIPYVPGLMNFALLQVH